MASQRLYNFESKAFEDVDTTQVNAALATGKYGVEGGQTVKVYNPNDPDDDGIYEVDSAKANDLFQQGFQLETPDQTAKRELAEKYKDSPILAGAAGAARGASLGLTDALGSAVGLKDDLRALKEENETASIVGEVLGGVGSAVALPGGGLVGAAARFGRTVEAANTARIGGGAVSSGVKSIVDRAASKGLGSAAEGAIYGVGQTVTEASLGDPQKAAENLIANVGVNALLGGALGVAMEAGSPILKAGKQFLPGVTQTVDAAGNKVAGTGVAQKVNELTAKAAGVFGADADAYLKQLNNPRGRLKAAATAGRFQDEIETVVLPKLDQIDEGMKSTVGATYEARQTSLLRQTTDNPEEYKKALDKVGDKVVQAFEQIEANPKFYSGATREALEQSYEILQGRAPGLSRAQGVIDEATEAMRAATQSADTAAIESATDALRRAEQAYADEQAKGLLSLRRYLDPQIPFGSPIKLTDDDQILLRKLRADTDNTIAALPGGKEFKEADALYKEYKSAHDNFFGEFIKRQPDKTREIDLQKAFSALKAGGAKGTKIDSLITKLEDFSSKLDAPEILEDIKYLKGLREDLSNFKDFQALKVNLGPSGRGALLGGFGGGMIASGSPEAALIGAVASPVIAPHAYLSAADTVTGVYLAAMERAQNVYAGKLSAGVKGAIKNLVSGTTVKAALLPSLKQYDLSESEKKSEPLQAKYSEYSADPVKLAETLSQSLGKTTQAAPAVSAAAISVASAAVTFLQSKAPRDPLAGQDFLAGAKQYKPPASEIARYRRYVEAVNNPMSVVKDLAAGRVSREGVEAIRTVYPSLFADLQAEVMEQVTEKKNLPHNAKLQLGILFGVPTIPSLQPQNMAAYQAGFAQQQAQQNRQAQSKAASTGAAQGSRMQTDINGSLNRGNV